ncbi:hypothetical protein [Ectobacillus polymachus]|uniref:hypothetical protein n=1 Tax=Ectobacillus polymachus TaxID=1508806 RepID=UPI003A844CE8
MKLRSSLIIPVLTASIFLPTVASLAASNGGDSSKDGTVTQQTVQKDGKHQKGNHGRGNDQQQLTKIINEYASAPLKDQLTKDMETHNNLMKQLHQSASFKNNKNQEKAERDAFYQANKQQIDSIKQQEKDGKITKQQAHQQMNALPGNPQEPAKADKQTTRSVHTELKTAIQSKDKAAITAALEKLDQQLQSENQQLQQKIEK